MSIRRRSLRLLIVLFLPALARPGAAQTAPVYNPANGHWYQLVRVPAPIRWPDARQAAEALSYAGYPGHLVTVTSAAEEQFVVSHVLGAVSDNEWWWMGGYQDTTAPDYSEPAGGWRWVTGEPWSYTDWGSSQPDNGSGIENFLGYFQGKRWNDFTDFNPGIHGYVVEYEPPPAPGPPVLGLLPNPVIGGQTTIGQVTLDHPATAGDLMVTLTSSDPAVAAVPAVVIVPAGSATALFSIVTFPVPASTLITLTAAGPAGSTAAPLQVRPIGAPPPDNLLANGSFEQPPSPAGQILRAPGDLPGWRIVGGSVRVVPAAVWPAAPGGGSQSLALVGDRAGAIAQSFPTIPGRQYRLSGWIAHDPANILAPEGRANVSLNGQFFVQLFHRDALATAADLHWMPFAYQFRASAATTTLTIADATDTGEPGGLVLDALVVAPVRENLLVNGSFEQPDVSAEPLGFRFVGPGELPGWQVPAGGVAVVHRHSWQPAPGQGDQVLHLLGKAGAAGAIAQSIATEPGRLYLLSGWVAHHPAIAWGRVSIFQDGSLLTQLFHSTALYGGVSPGELRWQPFLTWFRAVGATTTLQFVDATGISASEGAALDGLVVTPAEEPEAPAPPAAPSGLRVTAVSTSQVTLAWTDPPAPRVPGPDETAVAVWRKGGGRDWARVAALPPHTTSFTDSGLTPGTSYTYRVRVIDSTVASDWSNEVTVMTPAGV